MKVILSWVKSVWQKFWNRKQIFRLQREASGFGSASEPWEYLGYEPPWAES